MEAKNSESKIHISKPEFAGFLSGIMKISVKFKYYILIT